MVFGLFKKKFKSLLGVDIGTSSIKIVELAKEGERLKLENYAFLDLSPLEQENIITGLTDDQITDFLKRALSEANFKSKACVVSIPPFATFTTVIDINVASLAELEKAIPYEARKYIPVPLAEVNLDWAVIDQKLALAPAGGAGQLEVLLVAVSKDIINRYSKIIQNAGLELVAFEIEATSLGRSLIGNDKSALAIVNFGGRSTNINIFDKGSIRISHNIDIGGLEMTRAIARGLNISLRRAEELKKEVGLKSKESQVFSGDVLIPVIDLIVAEIKKTINAYLKSSNRNVERIILIGGTSQLAGIGDYFSKQLNIDVSLGNSRARIMYPPKLEMALKELQPFFAVAFGLAMRI